MHAKSAKYKKAKPNPNPSQEVCMPQFRVVTARKSGIGACTGVWAANKSKQTEVQYNCLKLNDRCLVLGLVPMASGLAQHRERVHPNNYEPRKVRNMIVEVVKVELRYFLHVSNQN